MNKVSIDKLRGKKGKDSKQVHLRMAEDFIEAIRVKAVENGRSLNSEILVSLRKCYAEN